MKTLFALLFIFLFTSNVVAGENKNEVEIHIGSYHTNPIYNNFNYGIGYNYLFNSYFELNSGYYKNSEDGESLYFGGTCNLYNSKKFVFGVGGILATGYKGLDIAPLVALVVKYKVVDSIAIKMAFTSSRYVYEPKVATELFHFSITKSF